MLNTPLHHGPHDGAQILALLGEFVLQPWRPLAVTLGPDHALLRQALQPVGQDVRGDALGGRQELRIAALAAQEVADDQQRPAIAEQLAWYGSSVTTICIWPLRPSSMVAVARILMLPRPVR